MKYVRSLFSRELLHLVVKVEAIHLVECESVRVVTCLGDARVVRDCAANEQCDVCPIEAEGQRNEFL